MPSAISANTTVASSSTEVSRVDFGPFGNVPMAIPLQLSFREPEGDEPFAPVLEYDATQTAPRAQLWLRVVYDPALPSESTFDVSEDAVVSMLSERGGATARSGRMTIKLAEGAATVRLENVVLVAEAQGTTPERSEGPYSGSVSGKLHKGCYVRRPGAPPPVADSTGVTARAVPQWDEDPSWSSEFCKRMASAGSGP